jgi:hypothetical protein
MSDTPRTDAFEALTERPINWWDFARELERENATLRAEVDQWASRCAAAIWMLPETVTGGQLLKAQNKFHRERENLRRENAALRAELNEEAILNGKGSEREAALLGKLERLERENATLREALTFYGDCQTYGLNGGNMKRILTDAGALARHALRKEAKP